MTPAHPQRFWLAALLVAWSVDFLFWEKQPGINFVVFTLLVLGALAWMIGSERVKSVWSAIVLAFAVLIAAVITSWRSEPLTLVLNYGLALGGLVLLVISLRNEGWLRFGVLNYLVAGVTLFVDSVSRAARLPLFPKEAGEDGSNTAFRRAAHGSMPVVRGLMLAFPIVIVFASLLAAADPIFGDNLKLVLKFFDLKNLPEYFVRMLYVLILAYLFAGTLLHALVPSSSETNQSQVTGIPRFLGSTEAFIVLVSVNALFFFFVIIQFRYFFGGQANITAAGYTYSQYARRGFFELVSVAVLTLMLILFLGNITRREQPRQATVFTALSGLLVALVWVMLVSAFLRLQLYEDAYGFTRLRMYTHVFIPWLGLLLLLTVVLQVFRRETYFLAVVWLVSAGFCFSMAIINVDGWIVQQNVVRANRGLELDGRYLANLSSDALPALVRNYSEAQTAPQVREMVGAVLTCHKRKISSAAGLPWQSYHPGTAAAQMELQEVDLSAYKVLADRGGYIVQYGGSDLLNCSSEDFD